MLQYTAVGFPFFYLIGIPHETKKVRATKVYCCITLRSSADTDLGDPFPFQYELAIAQRYEPIDNLSRTLVGDKACVCCKKRNGQCITAPPGLLGAPEHQNPSLFYPGLLFGGRDELFVLFSVRNILECYTPPQGRLRGDSRLLNPMNTSLFAGHLSVEEKSYLFCFR